MANSNRASIQLNPNASSISAPGSQYVARGLTEQERKSGVPPMDDRTDTLKEQYQWFIRFTSLPTDWEVSFKAFVTNFSDDYASSWEEKNVYGRMDPIPTFNRVIRKINISWQIPARDINEGIQNLAKCQDLISMLYPIYDNDEGKSSYYIAGAPLLKFYFTQMAQGRVEKKYNLLGYINGTVPVKPDYKEGVFYRGKGGEAVPRLIDLSCVFSVLHDFELGSGKDGLDRTYYKRYGSYVESSDGSEVKSVNNSVKSPNSDTKKDDVKNEVAASGMTNSSYRSGYEGSGKKGMSS
jgi:hypothetical protein